MRLRAKAERSVFPRTGVIFAGKMKNIQRRKKFVDKLLGDWYTD